MSVFKGKRNQDMTLIERMRNNLQPRGAAPVVQLKFNGVAMFDKEFVDGCIDELERMPLRTAVGEGPTNLEKLAYQLLMDSAHIDHNYSKPVQQFPDVPF